MLFLLTCYNFDSPVELKQNGRVDKLLALLRRCYATEAEVQFRMNQLSAGTQKDSSADEVTKLQVFTDPTYSKASWVGTLTLSFAQLTGINAVMFFSSQIFSDSGMSPFVAIGIINTVNWAATIGSMGILSFAGKRPVMIASQFVCILGMFGLFFFTVVDQNSGLMLTCCIIFIIAFETGPGPIGWPYVSEICHGQAVAIATMVNWFWCIFVGVLYPFLNGVWLEKGYADLIFVGTSIIGLLFYIIVMKESRGLTEEQKKRLYMPD